MISLRDIAKLLGNFTWATQTIPYAQAHYSDLQMLYIEKSESAGNNLQLKVHLNHLAREDLKWWIENLIISNGKPMTAVHLEIFTHASLT